MMTTTELERHPRVHDMDDHDCSRCKRYPLSADQSILKDTMLSRWCRVFYRARSRSQRRRLMLWMATVGAVLCLMYYNQQGLQVLSQMSTDARGLGNEFQPGPNEAVGRQPQALKQEKLREATARPISNHDPHDKEDEDEFEKSDLRSDLAPATLHFLWCGRRQFEFRHYMAMRRADKLVRPDKIFFHYEELPVVDPEGYYLWFNRTLAEINNILLRPFNDTTKCALDGADRYIAVLNILEKFGGIYVPEDAILVDFPVHLRSSSLVTGVQASSPTVFQDGLIAGRKGSFKKPTNNEELLVVLSLGQQNNGIQPCGTIQHYNMEEDGDCICVKVTTNIFPKDILESTTPFGTLARVASYDRSRVQHEHSLKNPIPRIAHYVCIDCEVRFITFLSMRSAVNVAGLSKVYLHGVVEPHGKWWEKLKSDSRFVYVHREYPEILYDRAVLTPQLAVAFMRISILLKYGGVFCDGKVLWTHRIPDDHFGYSAVASPDWHLYGSWPDSVNHDVLMAKKNSRYLHKVRAVLQKYRHNQFWFNDHFMAYKIYETHPESLWLDRHLQVKCLNHNCHPTWQPNYKSGPTQNRPGSAFSWANDTLSVHWTDTFPELDLDMVKYTSGMIVEISRHILHTSGIVIQELR